MSVHNDKIINPGIYFITFTCFEWLPLIEITKSYDLFYKWFELLESKGHCINAYTIMPNHVHLIMWFNGGLLPLHKVVGNGKRFMAYDITKRLKQMGYNKLLKYLAHAVRTSDRNKGQKHEVWQDSCDIKECRTEQFIMQKLLYIHCNPCRGRWKLAESIIDYPHSSAAFYISGKHGHFKVRDYRDFLGHYDDSSENE